MGTLGANLLGSLLSGKGILRAGSGRRYSTSSTSYEKKEKGIARAGYGKESDF